MKNAPIGTSLMSFDVEERRRLSSPGGAWFELAQSLARDLQPLEVHDAPIPTIKARLTRIGGRCVNDGMLLEFDPWSPHVHTCATCSAQYDRPEDHEWWAMGAQLWTAERAVHAAALYLLHGDAEHRNICTRILGRVADQYLQWPNRDNVLGPSRPFFSTYLESIWLLNICHALSLLERASATPDIVDIGAHVRRQLVAPSCALIASFHEGLSNRQVWNEVALLSAYRTLGDDNAFAQRASNSNGLRRLLNDALLDDGTWYEGENYHLFAHRGLWYGVELLRAANQPITAHEDAKYRAGFVAPFLGLLPDETFPSRRDSQYRVSIRQWRFAEWCELGVTHAGDVRLAAIRARLYDGTAPIRDTGRAWSTADAERKTPAARLTRADCSWRALLMASPHMSAPAQHAPAGSILLESQGLAVIRRDAGRVYVALEGGHSGGGHGHPDRLALTLQQEHARFLEDPGTGSYVERTLHWYRSSLAHAAPLVDRASQSSAPTSLLAWEDRGGAGWVVKRTRVSRDVEVTRRIIVCDAYLVDVVEWNATDHRVHEFTLPLCGVAELVPDVNWTFEAPHGAGGLEDGFDFLEQLEVSPIAGQLQFTVSAGQEHPRRAQLSVASSTDAELARANVPGAPGFPVTQRHWLRTRAHSGVIVSCWSWDSADAATVQSVQLNPAHDITAEVVTSDGTTALHSKAPHGWHIELLAGGARSSIDLEGLRDPFDSLAPLPSATSPNLLALTAGSVKRLTLGEQEYRRTEQSWHEAGSPTATVELRATDTQLVINIEARTSSVVLPAVAPNGMPLNVLDNERADVNADGAQVYFGTPDSAQWSQGWLIVPTLPSGRVTPLLPHAQVSPDCQAFHREDGWSMELRFNRNALMLDANGRCDFDLVINERSPDRERRRGQLVLSGGAGFSYLRGDRHEKDHAFTLLFL